MRQQVPGQGRQVRGPGRRVLFGRLLGFFPPPGLSFVPVGARSQGRSIWKGGIGRGRYYCHKQGVQLDVLSVFPGTVPVHGQWTPGSRKATENLLRAKQKRCQHPALPTGQELLELRCFHPLGGAQVGLSSVEEAMGKRPVACPFGRLPWRQEIWKCRCGVAYDPAKKCTARRCPWKAEFSRD